MKKNNEKYSLLFTTEIIYGKEKSILECYLENGIKKYKLIAKDGILDGIDSVEIWRDKIKKEKELQKIKELEL
ncbi:hypothetical protein [Fusobacterium sp. FSA-380-WT-2B]|uniref:hypothetical protein n=1 Tax=Fusobacterium sp. FSA-380-WT-2B TaxID=2605786 RepID=UPI0012B1C96C|nr:hypothetical protein [Fusobacterium sp. FSA-380-WT-2B]MSS61481.1 hypothetical protein [Fusobacterium sp. FSA-380-WT-2B]